MSQVLQATELDALFMRARASEPDLSDSNFTKLVINSLPAQVERSQQHAWLPDVVGIFVALFAIMMLVDPSTLLQKIPSGLPSNIIISVPNLVTVSLLMMVTSLIGWWVVEKI